MDRPMHLRVIVFRKDDHWAAQCLEHDIGVETEDFPSLQTRMEAALRTEQYAHRADGKHGLDGVPVSPQLYFHMWNARSIFNELGKSGDVSYEMALYIEEPAALAIDVSTTDLRTSLGTRAPRVQPSA
jgi:hypothetical protein